MSFMTLTDRLFRAGLGELPTFHSAVKGQYLGQMVYEKERLTFKDSGLLEESGVEQSEPDWDQHLLGMVCYRELLQWKSLTFYGIDHCLLPEGATATLRAGLAKVRNEEGSRLSDFIGSIYRAYEFLLANQYLPVVLLHGITAHDGTPGLAIGDLRHLSLPPGAAVAVEQTIRNAIALRYTVEVEKVADE